MNHLVTLASVQPHSLRCRYNDFALISETMEDLKERLWNWKDVQERKGLKVNTRKKSDDKRV